MNPPSLLAGIAWLLLRPASASADYGLATAVVNAVGGGLADIGSFGACSARGAVCIAETIVARAQWLIIPAATLTIIITGIRMIVGQEDEALEKGRSIISACVAGIVMSFLVGPFVAAFTLRALTTGPDIVESEVGGIINWALVLAAPVAVTMIILSAVKAMTKPEEGIANMRKTIVSAAAGILLLLFRFVLVAALGGSPRIAPQPLPIIFILVRILQVVLGFMGLAAGVMVIYAGILMILSFGKEDQFGKARGLIIRSLVGVVVILLSAAIVQFVLAASL